MSLITQDGFKFDSDWIDAHIAQFKDQKVPWAVRRERLNREIDIREADLQGMLRTMPGDACGHAHSRAYLVALRQTADDLSAEMFPSP